MLKNESERVPNFCSTWRLKLLQDLVPAWARPNSSIKMTLGIDVNYCKDKNLGLETLKTATGDLGVGTSPKKFNEYYVEQYCF
jgi:hypothetical protein